MIESALTKPDCEAQFAPLSHKQPRPSRFLTPLAVCFSLLFPTVAFGNTIGVGYFSGKTSGPVFNLELSASNSLKIIAPLSFENIICDYQYKVKNITKGSFNIQFYFGIGTDVILSGNNKKDKNDNNNGDLSVFIRVPVGVALRLTRFSADIFAELALSLQIYDGSDFNVDTGNIDRGKVGFGARYYF